MVMFDEKIYKKIENVIKEHGLELVDYTISEKGRNSIIKFFIDKRGGVTLDECEMISKRISEIFDTYEDIIEFNSYGLEVSSPGEDYPLTNSNDFLRKIGEKVTVTYSERDEEKHITGKISKVDDKKLDLNLGDKIVTINFNNVIDGKLKYDF